MICYDFQMTTIENILHEAEQLPADQRLTLANKILTSAEPKFHPSVEAAWDEEIRSRIDRIDRGETTARSVEEVFARLDSALAK